MDMLQNQFLPDLQAAKGNQTDRVIFQQDGATPHRRADVREWIKAQFPHRTIGLGLDVDWPARSPDLSTCDFFLWGYVKDLVYVQRPFRNVAELQLAITNVFDELRNRDSFRRKLHAASHGALSRMRRCVAIGGRQVESYRF